MTFMSAIQSNLKASGDLIKQPLAAVAALAGRIERQLSIGSSAKEVDEREELRFEVTPCEEPLHFSGEYEASMVPSLSSTSLSSTDTSLQSIEDGWDEDRSEFEELARASIYEQPYIARRSSVKLVEVSCHDVEAGEDKLREADDDDDDDASIYSTASASQSQEELALEIPPVSPFASSESLVQPPEPPRRCKPISYIQANYWLGDAEFKATGDLTPRHMMSSRQKEMHKCAVMDAYDEFVLYNKIVGMWQERTARPKRGCTGEGLLTA